MACSSLVALPRACGAEGTVGGVDKLYMIAFNDLAAVSGGTEVYGAASNGVVNNIGLDAGKTFVEIGLLQSTAGLNEEMTKDNTKGIAFFTQTATVVLAGISPENRTFVESVLNQPVAVLFKAKTGNFYVAGLSGSMELSALTGGLGVAPTDANGYTLTFTGISTKLIPQVDSTIVPSLIA